MADDNIKSENVNFTLIRDTKYKFQCNIILYGWYGLVKVCFASTMLIYANQFLGIIGR